MVGGDRSAAGFWRVAAFLISLLGGLPASAGTYSTVIENDVFSGTDLNYTSGLRVGYVTDEDRGAALARALLRAGATAKTRLGFAVGQSLYTPADIATAAPLPDQHPYAGWLYGEFSVIANRGRALDVMTLNLGVVGPRAFGEEAQNSLHRWLRGSEAQGWANQLRDEPGLILSFDRIWRPITLTSGDGLRFDITPHAGVSVGNVLTQAKAGLSFRFGAGLKNDFGPPRIRPSVSSGGYIERRPGLTWYLFAGGEARGVARNIFLDGNTFRDSLSVDKRPFAADAQGGIVVQVKRFQAAYTYVWRRREFETQDDPQKFGALSFSILF
jgi:hypothetical protein